MYNYRTGSTNGNWLGNSGGLNAGNIFNGPQQGQENPQLDPYMNQGYLPTFGMEAQQNPGPMPGMIGGLGGRALNGLGNMGGMGLVGQIAGQFNDPMTIKKVY